MKIWTCDICGKSVNQFPSHRYDQLAGKDICFDCLNIIDLEFEKIRSDLNNELNKRIVKFVNNLIESFK